MSEQFDKALAYARQMHQGQYRTGGKEYITHPIAVAEILAKHGYDEDYQICGLFHDLLEDTEADKETIAHLSSNDILHAVELLTKEENYVMKDYVAGIKSSPMARAVKAADRLHNLQCALVCNDKFRRRYVLETLEWYMDLDETMNAEIKDAVIQLNNSLSEPVEAEVLEH